MLERAWMSVNGVAQRLAARSADGPTMADSFIVVLPYTSGRRVRCACGIWAGSSVIHAYKRRSVTFIWGTPRTTGII